MNEFSISTDFINLQQLLKALNIAESGGHAKILIEEGEVSVNAETEFRKRRKLYPGDIVRVMEEEIKITSKKNVKKG
jgi:ribosome-associated protein